MKKLYLKMFSVVLALSAIMFTISVSSSLFSVNAANTGFAMKDAQVYMGASVEDDMSGIKFTASLSESEFATITNGKEDPVYFGIAISANGVEREICYLVDSTSKETKVNKAVTFENGVCEYTATITYNEEILATELAEDERFNPNGLTVEEFKASEVFQKYLTAAYTTELTAQAFYRVGNDDSVQYVACGNAITYSMMGIASDFYVDVNGEDNGYLDGKYFDYVEDVNVSVIKETGVVEYDFVEGDIVYVDGKVIAVDNGALSVDFVANYDYDAVITLCVISADGKLNVVNATVKSQNVVVEAQAFYDAAADKIYYTENGVQKTIQGSKDASFAYVVDASTSYALADYSGETMVSNVNYKYAKSVDFEYAGGTISNEERGLVGGLKPKLITSDGDLVVAIDYNPQTDVYKGVTVTVENDGLVYNFTNTVITSQMIDDASELKQVFNQADKDSTANISYYTSIKKYGTITKGVYMLANDIDCSTGFTFDNSAFNFFEGVFDGRGYNISNLDVSGSADNPGNGLFSGLSTYAAIQNVGFINVTANYGSVFQGNIFDVRLSAGTTLGTYAVSDIRTAASGITNSERTHGSTYYRAQLGIPSTDITTPITEYLRDTSRRGGENAFATIFSNVYVQVNPETQRLMGVISRNMPAEENHMNANNLVIEYLPDTDGNPETDNLYDSAEGANDGALPFGYDYVNGVYGVLYGGAYDTAYLFNGGASNRFDVPNGYTSSTSETVAKDYYTPNASYGVGLYSKASLAWFAVGGVGYGLTNGSWFNNKIYVISTVGLVSSVNGAILATNETASGTQLKFNASRAFYYESYGVSMKDKFLGDEIFKLERYDSYADLIAKGYTTEVELTSYMLDNGAELNYWDISEGYLKWRNVKAN